MNLKQFVSDINARHFKELEHTGLWSKLPDNFIISPGRSLTALAGLIWHATRSQDRMNADLFGEEPVMGERQLVSQIQPFA